ncbi:Uncharacterized protein APZ42_025071 [Daphnia magna]|uniref:Uncharacterized protein n=1 Tax=Daphnia magna TaxID=35525 RepID=A0A164THG8_9CRUS|nr:Uncharacterized protein APZ42_025071 [Daphnia magna]
MISLGDIGGKRKPSRLTPVSPILQKIRLVSLTFMEAAWDLALWEISSATTIVKETINDEALLAKSTQ